MKLNNYTILFEDEEKAFKILNKIHIENNHLIYRKRSLETIVLHCYENNLTKNLLFSTDHKNKKIKILGYVLKDSDNHYIFLTPKSNKIKTI